MNWKSFVRYWVTYLVPAELWVRVAADHHIGSWWMFAGFVVLSVLALILTDEDLW